MELKLYWTEASKEKLKLIFRFYAEYASVNVANKLILEIVNRAKVLELHQEIGQIEELLKSRKQEFRYLLQKKYKIIYWISLNKQRIEIVDVFDVRQNPIRIKRNK